MKTDYKPPSTNLKYRMKTIAKTIKILQNYIIFWFGQSLTQIASSMTSFAVSLWVFERTGSALLLSLLSVTIWVPRIIFGIFAGSFVDRMNKKSVLLLSDFGSAILTLIILFCIRADSLPLGLLYVINLINGMLYCFQTSAAEVTQSIIVPKEYYIKTSGMRSLSSGAAQLISPALASFLYIKIGINGVIAVDIITFLFAFLSLIFIVKIPNIKQSDNHITIDKIKADISMFFNFIKENHMLNKLMYFFCFVNFLSGITYFSLITPLILSRTDNNAAVLAGVNMLLGIGSIIGGVFITIFSSQKNAFRNIFISVGLSFLFGDLLLAFGKSEFLWYLGAFFASVFIPVSNANEMNLWRTNVDIEMQGRILSYKRTLQSAVRPIGMLIGGILADYIFEPYIVGNNSIIGTIVGNQSGSGIAFMFLLTGIGGSIVSFIAYYKFTKKHVLPS